MALDMKNDGKKKKNKKKKPTQRVKDEYPDTIYVAFFEHGQRTDRRGGFWDAAWTTRMKVISPRYEHCQIVFEWQSENETTPCQRITFSTTERDPSSFVDIEYGNRNWTAKIITPLSCEACKPARHTLFKWARKNEGKPFNARGSYCNFVPPATCCACCSFDAAGEAFFCAEQVAVGLKIAGVPIFADVRPYMCTPDDVYRLLHEIKCPETTIAMPSKKCRMLTAARMSMMDEEGDEDSVSVDIIPGEEDDEKRESRSRRRKRIGCCSRLAAALIVPLCCFACCCCGNCIACRYPESHRVLDLVDRTRGCLNSKTEVVVVRTATS
jgi:hypothetical protein